MTIDEINTIRLALDTPEHNRHYIKHVTDAKIILNKEQEVINFTNSSLQLKTNNNGLCSCATIDQSSNAYCMTCGGKKGNWF